MSSLATPPTLKSLGVGRICVALDKSGSTAGHTLNIERKAVRRICDLRVPDNQHPVRLLPWSDEVLEPINLPDDAGLDSIQGRGGTNPAVLYDLDACVQALKDCDIWFLLTDGEIVDNLVENFAVKTAELGLHNKPCVIIVFGNSSIGPPAKCNISVGIATFAVVPDCLFLFHDLENDVISLMQAKGRFKNLLSGSGSRRPNPLITKYTIWAELPKISYADLSRLQISSVAPLRRDEVALPGGMIVQLDEVLKGNVDPETMERIVKDEDNLKSIIISSMTKGTGKTLESWLEAQQRPMPVVDRHREDVEDQAKSSLSRLLEALGNAAVQNELDQLRAALRNAHHKNWDQFKKQRHEFNSEHRAIRVHNQLLRNGWEMQHDYDNMYTFANMGRDMYLPDLKDQELRRGHNDSNSVEPVFLPAFQRGEATEEFAGRCMLCHETRVLCLLFKVAPNLQTDNFPQAETFAKLAFPLAMGNFAETDVLSFFVCCDWCGYYLERSTACPYKDDKITFALCLVGMKENQKTWLEALDTALKGRFDITDLMAIFVAILNHKVLENNSRGVDTTDKDLFRACADWATRKLMQIAEVPATLSPAFSQSPTTVPRAPLQDLVAAPEFAEPAQPHNVDLLLIRYPVAGFAVLLRLLQLRGLAEERIQTLIFHHVMFHVMEQLFARRASGGAELFVEDLLGREEPRDCQGQPQPVNDVVSLPIEQLKAKGLLESETLSNLETIPEFSAVKVRAGPAMRVFLHHLFKYSNVHVSPVACFNALKGIPTMRNVALTPLAISIGLSADLISQV